MCEEHQRFIPGERKKNDMKNSTAGNSSLKSNPERDENNSPITTGVLLNDDGGLLYEGFLYKGKPYLLGKLFYPDGGIYHTHEASYTLTIVKCSPVLPNGNIDTSSDMFEEGGWVPIGDTIDVWISYGKDSKTPISETVITHEDGRVTNEVKTGLDRDDDALSQVPPDCTEEFDEDSEGNWIRHRLVKKNGSVAIEIVREIVYW